jgi:hypothetical protein
MRVVNILSRVHFQSFGDIEEAAVIMDRTTGKSRGYGFVSSKQNMDKGILGFFFYVLYSTLLHLPPLRFHCVVGCWDQDYCDSGISMQSDALTTGLDLIHYSARSHQPPLILQSPVGFLYHKIG